MLYELFWSSCAPEAPALQQLLHSKRSCSGATVLEPLFWSHRSRATIMEPPFWSHRSGATVLEPPLWSQRSETTFWTHHFGATVWSHRPGATVLELPLL